MSAVASTSDELPTCSSLRAPDLRGLRAGERMRRGTDLGEIGIEAGALARGLEGHARGVEHQHHGALRRGGWWERERERWGKECE